MVRSGDYLNSRARVRAAESLSLPERWATPSKMRRLLSTYADDNTLNPINFTRSASIMVEALDLNPVVNS